MAEPELRRQRLEEPVGRFLLKILVTTAVYFKLSIFQRHHAKHRIFPSLATRRERAMAARPAPCSQGAPR